MAYDKVVDSEVLDGKLTAIADAIRGKTGGTEELTLEQMVTEIAGIQAGGGSGGDESALFVAVNNNTLTDFALPDGVDNVREYMFYGNSNLKTADLSALIANVQGTIGDSAFYNCTGLESVVFPIVSSYKAWIGARAFFGCSSLKEVYIPCQGFFSSATTYVFQNCDALTKFVAPLWTLISSARMFSSCSALSLVDVLGGAIGASYFENCPVLTTLVFRSTTVCKLANANAFNGTPFASGGAGGTVYVPQALIESYQTATNWSTLYAYGTCNFVAIEGSEYE